MANEGIRLPSDSTVASQKVQRGHGLPETKALPQSTKQPTQVTPLLTVVLQSRPLIEGKNQALYELVLQNDPKSAPPIQLQADTAIKPGTSLLLELDENGQYRPVDKPTTDQLQKLIKLELEFWRAQLLPKAGSKAFPTLPATDLLIALSKTTPELTALVKWLTQQPSQLSGKLIANWLKELTPLSNLRPWATPTAATPATNTAPQQTAELPVTRAETTSPQIVSRPNSPASLLLVIDPRLQRPVGFTTPSFVQVMQKTGLVGAGLPLNVTAANNNKLLASALSQVPRVPQVTESSPMAISTPKAPTMTNTTPLATADIGLRLNGQLFRLAEQPLTVTSKELHFQYSSQRVNTMTNSAVTTTPLTKSNQVPGIPINETASFKQPTLLTLTPNTVAVNPTQTGNKTSSPLMPAFANTAAPTVNTATENAVTPNTKTSWINALASAPTRTDVSSHQGLAPPATQGRQPADMPLEIKLGQWLLQLDKQIAQNPTHAQLQLKTRASELLQQLSEGAAKIAFQPSSDAKESPRDTDEPTLLALRNWVESTLARIQHSAIQSSAVQWANSDVAVNQMQLPLIWLGLTSWADIEWWQEKPAKKDKSKKDEHDKRRWRMKIYLSLAPLADMCADIDWTSENTNVTFWSEDTATLRHMSQLMPALHRWTDGLGEKSIHTKHGMPKRRTESETSQTEQHLVDIRT